MQRILIIGATSAIAHATARLWAEQGAQLFLVGRNLDKLQQNAADLQTRGANSVMCHVLDFTDTVSHALMLERALEHLGQIDIALVAHGSLPDQQQCEQDPEVLLDEFSLNAASVIVLSGLLAGQLERQGSGALAVISSVAGDRGRASNYLYGSAKAAVSTFCAGLHAKLHRQGIHVMTVKPGFVDTPMTQGLQLPSALVAAPEKVAKGILRGLRHRKAVLYTPWIWCWIMLIIKHIPNFIFRRLNL